MWVINWLRKKHQYNEEMYQRWVVGIIGLSISAIVTIIAVCASFK